VARHVYQGCDHARVASTGHDARQPQHVGSLIAPHPAEVDGPAIADPHRVTAEQPREMNAHGEVVDVGRVNDGATHVTTRHQRVETPRNVGAYDAGEAAAAHVARQLIVVPGESADQNSLAPFTRVHGDGRQRVQHLPRPAGDVVRSQDDPIVARLKPGSLQAFLRQIQERVVNGFR